MIWANLDIDRKKRCYHVDENYFKLDQHSVVHMEPFGPRCDA